MNFTESDVREFASQNREKLEAEFHKFAAQNIRKPTPEKLKGMLATWCAAAFMMERLWAAGMNQVEVAKEVNEHASYCGALHGAQKATLGRIKANFNEYSLAAEIVNRTLAVRAASTN